MGQIVLTDSDTGEQVLFYVMEETTLAGKDYLLVTEEEEGDCDAYILQECAVGADDEVTYEIVEDAGELNALSRVFAELLDEDTVLD